MMKTVIDSGKPTDGFGFIAAMVKPFANHVASKLTDSGLLPLWKTNAARFIWNDKCRQRSIQNASPFSMPAPSIEVQRGNSYSCRADDYDDVDDVVQIIFEKSIKKNPTQPQPSLRA